MPSNDHFSSDQENAGRVYAARLSDGETAGSKEVGVVFTADGLSVQQTDGTAANWTFSSLATATPITRHAIDVILTSDLQPGSSLFIPNADAARRLAQDAPHLTARATRWRVLGPLVGLAAAIVAVFALMHVLDISPARGIAMMLPDSARKGLGRDVISSLTRARAVCKDERGRAALDRLAERLAGTESAATFKITVVDWSLVNAFAVPGEQIVLTRGLIEQADDPDQVAGVLAHEMAHGILRHPETSFVRALGLSAGAQLLFGGDGGSLASFGVMLAQLSYSRGDEREADSQGLKLLKHAEVSPLGLATFLGQIAKKRGRGKKTGNTSATDDGSSFDLLSTHPALLERQKAVRAQASYSSRPSLSTTDWADLRKICTPSS